MGSVERRLPPACFVAVLAAGPAGLTVPAAAEPAPPVGIQVLPEHRTIYGGAFLVLRDARACRLPEGVTSTGDYSRGIRVTIDGLNRYQTGAPQFGGSARRTRVYYGDPDDLIVRFHGSKVEGEYTVVIECRDEQWKWTKVAEKSFPAVTGLETTLLPVVPVENPVITGGALVIPCNSPCRAGDEGHHEFVLDERRLTESAGDVAKQRMVRQFKVPPGLRPGIQPLQIRAPKDDGTLHWTLTVPVITRFDENGAAEPLQGGRPNGDGGTPRWTWPAAWVLGGAALLLTAVRLARRR